MLKIYSVDEARQTILRRDGAFTFAHADADARVRDILDDVRLRGDVALQEWTEVLDEVKLDRFRVSAEAITTAPQHIAPDLYEALQIAAKRIEQFHRLQPLPNWTTNSMGGTLGQRVTPIERVGVYVPGGTAPLPSSLLMAAIPARVAGVREIVAVTPPDKNGTIPDVILAAAHIAGVDEVYALGGAQAIGALAFGTESVPRVAKIVGPGGLYVTLAKRQVYGIVGIDGLYGPTETMVIADERANVEWVSADLLAQAEHDTLASAILLTPSQQLANAVLAEIESQFNDRQRKAILQQSLTNQSGIILTPDLDTACQLANEYAPEHLCLSMENPEQWVDKIKHAGGLFIGERSFEVLGDYVAGPSHTMPTGGTAHFASPLNVSDFVKISSIIQLDTATAAKLSPVAARIAQAEQLDAHAYAAQLRNPS